jgi:hypothetical protein
MVDITMPTGTKIRDGYSYTPATLQDFTTPAAVGQVRSVYTSMGYYAGFNDTAKAGLYDPDHTLSVHDSVLDIHQYTLNGQPLSAAIMPDNYAPHLYGRMDIRYKITTPGDGYKWVVFYWPSSDNWDDGEIDFPEAPVTGSPRPASATTPPLAKSPTDPSRMFLPLTTFNVPTDQTAYHVASTEWRRDAIIFYWDDVEIYRLTDTRAIPTKSMRVTWQAETWDNAANGGTPVPAATDTHILVDWVAIYGPPVAVANATLRIGGIHLDGSAPNLQTVRVGGITMSGTPVATVATLRVGGITMSGTTANVLQTLRIGGISFSGTPAVGRNTLIIGGITLNGVVGITLGGVSSRVVNPYDTVTTTVAPVTGSPDAVSYTWRQISGPPVTLTGSFATRSFVAPAGGTGGTSQTVVLGVFATDASTNTSGEQQISVTILPHTLYELVNGAWSPRPLLTL